MREKEVGYIYMGIMIYIYIYIILPLESLSPNETCVPTGENPRLGETKPDAEIKAASGKKNARFAFNRKDKKHGSELILQVKH